MLYSTLDAITLISTYSFCPAVLSLYGELGRRFQAVVHSDENSLCEAIPLLSSLLIYVASCFSFLHD